MATLTSNTNFLSPIEFKFVIDRLPNVEFFVKSANVPGISSGSTVVSSPFKNIDEPGDRLSYDELTVSIICDENMVAFKEISDWLVALTFPKDFTQYSALNPNTVGTLTNTTSNVQSDASLIVLNSNKNANVTIKFSDMFPTAVGSIQLDTSGTDLTPPTFDITFKYNSYTIEV